MSPKIAKAFLLTDGFDSIWFAFELMFYIKFHLTFIPNQETLIWHSYRTHPIFKKSMIIIQAILLSYSGHIE